MKNILIIGTGRAGKTPLSNMIKNRWNSYNLLHSDCLKWAIIRAQGKEDYYRENVDIQKEYEHGEFFQKTLLNFYNSLIEKDSQNYGYILETGSLSPKIVSEMIDFNKTLVLCLGLGNLTPSEMVEQCIKYDTKGSWTYGLDKDYLLKHAKYWHESNEVLKTDCPKYNIKYFDTSINREKVFDEILSFIEENAKV